MQRPEAARTMVDRCLQQASGPIDAREVARRCELPLQIARNCLSNGVRFKRIRNVGAIKHGLYEWMPPQEAPVLRIETSIPKEVYAGEKPLPMRPGAEDFLQYGSVENGALVERKRPALISAANEKRRVA